MVNPEGPLTDDEARMLFDEHIEGFLEESDHKRVDDALLASEELRQEYETLRLTMLAYQSLDAPVPPADMRERVLSQLKEREADDTEQKVVSLDVRRSYFRRGLMYGAALAATVLMVLTLGFLWGESGGGPQGINTAGLSNKSERVPFSVYSQGIATSSIIESARATKVVLINDPKNDTLIFEGERKDIARFLMELRLRNAQGEVRGVIPQGEAFSLTLHTKAN